MQVVVVVVVWVSAWESRWVGWMMWGCDMMDKRRADARARKGWGGDIRDQRVVVGDGWRGAGTWLALRAGL